MKRCPALRPGEFALAPAKPCAAPRTDGCSRASSLALREPHVATNLLLGLAARFLQSSLQLLLVRRFAGRPQSRPHGKIGVNLPNRHLAAAPLFRATPSAPCPP